MRTRGQALRDKIVDSASEIERIMSISHLEEDYAKLFKILGGEIEKFLKETVFQGQYNQSFYRLIEHLKTCGIDQNNIDTLHRFREIYNGYKHEPGYSERVNVALQVLQKTGNSIDEIVLRGLGDVHQPYLSKSKRMVWFAGWDDYVGGMTEFDIFIPNYRADFPIGIDHYNISFEGWDQLIQRFTASGDLKMGPENVSEKAYRVWKANDDLIGVGSFNGELSEFVRALAEHQSPREKNLMSFLKRENDSTSVKAAIAFSLFDSLRQNMWINRNDLKDEINLRASYDYGINISSPYLAHYLDLIDYQAIENSRNMLMITDDILWLDEEKYHRSKTTVLSNELYIAIDSNSKILVRLI